MLDSPIRLHTTQPQRSGRHPQVKETELDMLYGDLPAEQKPLEAHQEFTAGIQ